MISSASTLLLVTLVLNAASVFGAPLRIPDTVSEVAARAELSTPVQPVARADIVDVEDYRRRSQIGTLSRRVARLVLEREEPFSEGVVSKQPAPAAASPVTVVQPNRRYPRRILHDLYEKREPAPDPQPVPEPAPEPQPEPAPAPEAQPEPAPEPIPVAAPRALRYPRRVLHDFFEKREPATSVKETTLITTKVTVHDTPADAAAFAAGQAAGANAANVGASASTLSISIPLPSIPAVVNLAGSSGSSTVVSISQTTTVSSPGATGTASSTASSSAASATATESSSASATSATASATASASATSSAAAGEPTGTTTTTTTTTTGGDKAEGDGKAAAAPAAGASAEPTVDGTTSVPAGTESRRWVKASNQPIARRMAVSGASMASAVRRQLESVTSDFNSE